MNIFTLLPSQMDKKRVPLISTAVLAATLIFVGYEIKIPYKQQISSQQGITNTISVAGEGKSYATPDTLQINISVSELGKTTSEAQKITNDKIGKVKDVLTTFDVKKENIQTTNVNVNPEYDWTNNTKKMLGYRSQQSLTIEVNGENFSKKGADIIAKIWEIGNINVDSSSFILKDKAKATEEARAKAFEEAKKKAEQLAKLWGVDLGKPTMIADQDVSYSAPIYYAKEAMGAGDSTMNTQPLSPGQTEITIRINITYEIK